MDIANQILGDLSFLMIGFSLGVVVTHHLLVKPLEEAYSFWKKEAIGQLTERVKSTKDSLQTLKTIKKLLNSEEPMLSPFQPDND